MQLTHLNDRMFENQSLVVIGILRVRICSIILGFILCTLLFVLFRFIPFRNFYSVTLLGIPILFVWFVFKCYSIKIRRDFVIYREVIRNRCTTLDIRGIKRIRSRNLIVFRLVILNFNIDGKNKTVFSLGLNSVSMRKALFEFEKKVFQILNLR
jgi:hypothetical protein